MYEFDDEEIVISQYTSQLMVLWQNGYMHRPEKPDIVVQFHGAPLGTAEQKNKEQMKLNDEVRTRMMNEN